MCEEQRCIWGKPYNFFEESVLSMRPTVHRLNAIFSHQQRAASLHINLAWLQCPNMNLKGMNTLIIIVENNV